MNQNASDWIYFLLVLMGLVCATLLPRCAFLLLPSRWQLPPAALEALRYAPLAAIAAIIAPDLIAWRSGGGAVAQTASVLGMASVFSVKSIAALFAAALHWRFANMLLTIAGGMAVFWLLRWAAWF